MSSSAKKLESLFVATKVSFTDDFICLQLSDGREMKAPLEFYPRLKDASSEARNKFRLIGMGTGIHWDALDEDLTVEGIVLGRKSASK